MDGPSDNLRAAVGGLEWTRRADARADRGDAEDSLAALLTRIERELTADVEGDLRVTTSDVDAGDDSWDLLAAVEAWAGVSSAAVSQVYAPASPWPRRVGGWGKKAIAALQRIIKILLTPLQVAAKGVGASSWSIGVSFPWGLSVSLSWP
jgi:hypothetical protein